jgi:hypothetical protein
LVVEVEVAQAEQVATEMHLQQALAASAFQIVSLA